MVSPRCRRRSARRTLETLDTLITSGIATSRSEAARWALARVREQPAYAELGERAPDSGEVQARATLERAVQDRLQTELDERGEGAFPRRGGAAGRAAAVRRRPVGPAGRPGGPGDLRRDRGGSAAARLGSEHDAGAGNCTASSRRRSLRPGTSSSGSAERPATKAESCNGCIARRTVQADASATHPGRYRVRIRGPGDAGRAHHRGRPTSRRKPSAGSWPASASGQPTRGSASRPGAGRAQSPVLTGRHTIDAGQGRRIALITPSARRFRSCRRSPARLSARRGG